MPPRRVSTCMQIAYDFISPHAEQDARIAEICRKVYRPIGRPQQKRFSSYMSFGLPQLEHYASFRVSARSCFSMSPNRGDLTSDRLRTARPHSSQLPSQITTLKVASARGSVVVKALCCKPEGRGFKSR
jgi:hypothetical protein